MARRFLLLLVFLLAACGGHSASVAPLAPRDAEPVQERAATALKLIRRDFAAHLVPNRWGVDAARIHLRGPTLEAWSTLRRTRPGMRLALGLCERMYHRYVSQPAGALGVGQAAVYSRAGVLLTASLRYKARCYALTKVAP